MLVVNLGINNTCGLSTYNSYLQLSKIYEDSPPVVAIKKIGCLGVESSSSSPLQLRYVC